MAAGLKFMKFPVGRVMIKDFLELTAGGRHARLDATIDVGKILDYIGRQEKGGLKIPIAAVMLKGLGLAVRRHPEARTILYSPPPRLVRFDICTATIPVEREIEGEKVPFFVHIKDCDKRPIRDIAFEVKKYRSAPMEEVPELGTMLSSAGLPKAVRRAIYLPFMHLPFMRPVTGGTFGFAELGVEGVDGYSPIATETVTFGMGSVRERPLVRNGVVTACKTAPLSMVFDVRAIDGKSAETFFGDCVKTLEEAAFAGGD